MKKIFSSLSFIVILVLTLLFAVSCGDKTVTVTFDSDGGTPVEAQEVKIGEFAKEPEIPTKEGYKFSGWYLGLDKWNFDLYAVGADMTLKAKWNTDCTVTFDSNGGTAVKEQVLAKDSLVSEPNAPKREGYEFLGWYNGEIKWDFKNEPITKDVTLKAHWLKLHQVTFDTDGGTLVSIQTIRDGEPVSLPDAPTKEGFVFSAWYYGEEAWDFASELTSDITLKAVWTPVYTVSFYPDGGTDTPKQSVIRGEKASIPTAPTKSGYVFAYWYDSTDAEMKAWDFENNTITRDISLKAKWRKIHTVSFDTNGGSTIASIKVVDGDLITGIEAPTKALYLFDAWMINETTAWNLTSDKVTSDITLTAKWRDNYYTVIFNLDGGEGAISQQLVELGKTVTKPQNPTKENHAFVCWLNAGTEWNFETDTITELNKTITLTANWARDYFVVTFDTNGADAAVPSQNVPKVQGTIQRPEDPQKAGFVFSGWLYNGNLWNFALTPTDDITLTARWTAEFTVSFNSDGGTAVAEKKILDGQLVIEPPKPTKSGFIFDAWYKGDEKWDFQTPITENITLTAKWKITYTVTFDLNGGHIGESSSIIHPPYEENSFITHPGSPTKNGFYFSGWYNGDSLWDFQSDKITSSITLTAKWLHGNTVSFNTNGGEGTYSNRIVKEGEKITKPTVDPKREHYTFGGWCTRIEDVYTPWNFDTELGTENVELVALWIPVVYKITFDANKGTPNPTEQNVSYGSLITKPADPARTDEYEFDAWYDEFGNKWDFTKTPERDMKLIAHWYQLGTSGGSGTLGPWDETNNIWGELDEF